MLGTYFGRSRAPSILSILGHAGFNSFVLPEMLFLKHWKKIKPATTTCVFFSGIYSTSPNPTAAYLTSQHMHGYGAQQMPLQPQQHQQQAGHRST